MFSRSSNHDKRMSNQVVTGTAPIPRRRFPYLIWPIWIVWLPLLIPPVMDLIRAEQGTFRLVATLIGLAAFVGIYMWASLRNAFELTVSRTPLAHISGSKWIVVGTLIGLSFILALLGRVNSNWLDPFIFSSAYVSGSLPSRKAVPVIAVIVVLSLTAGGIMGIGWFEVIQTNIILIVTWVTTMSMVRTIVASRALDVAREEIARLAVTNERLRIARDLHDLLGHNLSLIALKSELARRLIDVAPERAIIEITDVENVARTTLQEVREAVGQYRQPTLSSELHGAQEILTAAGIEYQYEGPSMEEDTLPAAIEAALGWVVREGVTNVIRHSRARHCTIRVTRDRKVVTVEIIDNGALIPLTAEASGDSGHGLHGLTERIAELGGYSESGPQLNGGFRLAVSVPLAAGPRGIPGTEINQPGTLELTASSESNKV